MFISSSIKEPTVKEKYIQSISQNAKQIKSLNDTDDYSDLKFLQYTLKDKKIVILGESSHFIEEYSQIKGRLIKYLTKELGYDVVLFESPMAELFHLTESPHYSIPDSLLKYGIFNMWHTKTNLELITYLKKNNINIAGFDIQINSYKVVLEYLRQKLANIVEKNKLEDFIKQDSSFLLDRSDIHNFNKIKRETAREHLIKSYEFIIEILLLKKDLFSTPDFEKILTVLNSKKQLSSMYGKNYSPSIRDSLMAENINWLTTNLYKNKKIIIWAHNYHIMKDYPLKRLTSDKTMGVMLSNTIKDDSYIIGIYCYKGQALNNKGIYTINTPHDNSMEAIIHKSGFNYSFLDFKSMPNSDNNSWIYKPIEALYSGLYIKERLVLSRCYDGIIQIDSVSPAVSLHFN
jgi:erythromycin esterase